MIMPRPLTAISRRKTLPLSVITPSIWPRGGSPYWPICCTCALIKWESARAFIRSAMASPWGLRRGSCHPIHLFFSLSLDPTKTRLHRTWGGAKSHGDTDSHEPSVSLCTHPLSILFDLTPRTSHVNPSTRPIRPFSLSVSTNLHELSFRVFVRALSLTASRENESTDLQRTWKISDFKFNSSLMA